MGVVPWVLDGFWCDSAFGFLPVDFELDKGADISLPAVLLELELVVGLWCWTGSSVGLTDELVGLTGVDTCTCDRAEAAVCFDLGAVLVFGDGPTSSLLPATTIKCCFVDCSSSFIISEDLLCFSMLSKKLSVGDFDRRKCSTECSELSCCFDLSGERMLLSFGDLGDFGVEDLDLE